jgi:hypothetical protein
MSTLLYYGSRMGWMQAAGWGLAGGLSATVASLMAAVKAAGYRWPWQIKDGGTDPPFDPWAWIFVMTGGLLLGALVAAAAHGQMSGGWPAFIMGIGAPATVRGVIGGVEVREREPTPLGVEPQKEVPDAVAR